MTKEQIAQSWKENGEQARNTGTCLHKFIENYYNGLQEEAAEHIQTEVEMFKDWASSYPSHYKPMRTEWVIYDDDLKIAGTIDMLFSLDEYDRRRVAIYDWKCSKEIKRSNKYERAREPLSHLDDCNYNHYCLQLNLYKYLLEKNYDLKVEEMFLVVIHRSRPEVQLVPIPDCSDEIFSILK